MATCEAIITRAFQKAKITGSGVEPTAEEAADALSELQGLYTQWGAGGLFGRISDVLTANDYDAGENERIRVTDGATITLPTEYSDDVEGGYRAPYDLSFVEVVDVDAQTVERHIWSNGAWVAIDALTLNDEAPLSEKGEAGLSACLALILAEEFGGEIGPIVARQAGAFKTMLSLKLGSVGRLAESQYF